MESSQREKGPAPILWRASDFLKWTERFKNSGKYYEDWAMDGYMLLTERLRDED